MNGLFQRQLHSVKDVAKLLHGVAPQLPFCPAKQPAGILNGHWSLLQVCAPDGSLRTHKHLPMFIDKVSPASQDLPL